MALDVGRPRLHAGDVRLLQLQLGRVLDGDQAARPRDEGESALSIVVLPVPVPPEMIVVLRACTAAVSTSAMFWVIAPNSTSLLSASLFLENLRIETSGPSTPTAGSRR